MKFVYLSLNWTFGVLFLLSGVLSLIESPWGGLTLIAIAMFFLPPSRNFVYSKTNKELSIKEKSVAILVLFIVAGVLTTKDQSTKKQELIAQESQEELEKEAKIRKERIDYFEENRDQIISATKEAFILKDYQSVVLQAQKYSVTKDKELEEISTNAQKELSIIEREKKTKVLEQQEKARIAKEKLQKEVKTLVGKKVPYKKWSEWGYPETLKGTNNKYWVAYLPTANISFVSEKKTDIIIFSGLSKENAQNFVAKHDAKKWYEKGTLHNSTIEEWKHSTYENKISTSADWILSISKSIKSQVQNSGSFDNLKPYCKELVICIDKTVEGHESLDHSNTKDTAILCMTLMGWLK